MAALDPPAVPQHDNRLMDAYRRVDVHVLIVMRIGYFFKQTKRLDLAKELK